MLALPDVTLVCADTVNHALAARALAKCCERVRFGRALFLSDAALAPTGMPAEVELLPIAPLATRDAYSQLMLKGLARYVETSHALVVQWDGYVVNPDAWTDEFLAFDYIGAPWPWGEADRRIGNGGFSLRSRRLLDALAARDIALVGNEDETIGIHHRRRLEGRDGIVFPPVELANRFSFEVAYPVGMPFGFHGLFNFCRVATDAEIAALAPAFSDAIALSPQLASLVRNCAAMGQWLAAEAIASRILAANAERPDAVRIRDEARAVLARGPAVGRNDPCPCGSGKRYKACHGALAGAAAAAPDPDAIAQAGLAAHREGRYDDADRAYRETLAIAPEHVVADHYLGVVEMHRGRLVEATARLERTLASRPSEPDFHVHLGLAYADADRLDEAIAVYRRALALAPDHAGAWSNLGLALQQLNRLDEAVDAYRAALKLAPDAAVVRWNLATARLARGERDAWDDYESRLAIRELGGELAVPGARRLDDLEVRGLRVLLDAEQGHGDTIQWIRYARPLADRGARVVARVPAPLAGLVASVSGVDQVVGPDDPTACDAWLPMGSLPGLFRSAPQGADAPSAPYLAAEPAVIDAVRAELEPRQGRLAIGLSWAGRPSHRNDRRRSCPLSALAPWLQRTDIDWYSLQRGDGEEQIPGVPEARRLRLPSARNDYGRKAALMTQLDLVVSVDTSNAHLAGALGRPVWILLPFAAEWRWGPAGSSTGWYASARLWRQREPGDWDGVVRDAGAALDAWTPAP